LQDRAKLLAACRGRQRPDTLNLILGEGHCRNLTKIGNAMKYCHARDAMIPALFEKE
jgi:hypothetical protein